MGNLSERWQQAQAKALERDLLPGWYATRGRRRLLAAAGVLSLVIIWVDAVVTWALAPGDDAALVSFILLAVMLVLYLPAVTLLNIATRGVTALSERDLDERQVSERLRATALAHRVTTGILVAFFIAVFSVGVLQGPGYFLPGAALTTLAVALMLTHFVLPLLISAWRLPDPPPDET